MPHDYMNILPHMAFQNNSQILVIYMNEVMTVFFTSFISSEFEFDEQNANVENCGERNIIFNARLNNCGEDGESLLFKRGENNNDENTNETITKTTANHEGE